MIIKIEKTQAGQRLDIFLNQEFSDFSRSQLQKMVKQGAVLINEKSTSSHYILKEDDQISIDFTLPAVIEKPVKDMADTVALNLFKKIEIIKETPEYLIINKPAGLLVHGATSYLGLTLVDWLLEHDASIKKIGEDPERPGIVHRLDKDVSGIMVIPKTQDSFDNLKEQFQKRTISKYYEALTFGPFEKNAGEINFVIDRSTSGYKMAAKPISQGGKVAITEYEVIKNYINFALVKLKIKTGRTHQIRVHLNAFGHPVVGDNLYGNKMFREKNRRLALKRLFLVSRQLAFTDLAGERQEFNVELPKDLQEFMKKVK